MAAYYNEHDKFAAAWLRELIKAGHIAPGEVDERDIRDVIPSELAGFTQCHFFAGIGVWSYALRCAGWSDDRPAWTGSCPCQPFSSAGKGGGFDDERHLWPAWDWLIEQCRPQVIFGEQVASKDGLAWLDLVSVDLEGKAYAIGALDTCAAGFGAPHIRQRLYWVADTSGSGRGSGLRNSGSTEQRRLQPADSGIMVDAERARLGGHAGDGRDGSRRQEPARSITSTGTSGDMANAANAGQFGRRPREASQGGGPTRLEPQRLRDASGLGEPDSAGSQPGQQATPPARHGSPALAAGGWSDIEWIACRDGKVRPTKPGLFPLAHRTPARVGRLRGYGNAIVAPQAEEFIRAYLDVRRQ